MSKADELKKEVRESVAKLVQDVMTDSVSRLTKAATKRALKKLKEKLKEKAIHKLEEHLTDISEQGLDGKLDKGAQQIADQLDKRVGHEVERITQDNFERVDFREIEKSLEKSFKKPLSSPVQPVVISIVTVAVIGGGLWTWTRPPEPPPPLPPSPPTPSLVVPAAPANLVGEAVRNQIGLTWTDNSYNETGFRIMCSTNDGIDFTLIDSVPANATEFNHTELIPGTEYIYYVYAYNAAGDSEPSNTVSVTLLVAPAAPTGLVGKAVSNQIELTWTDNSYNETGFLIQCSTNDGNTFAEIGTTPANDPAFNHTKNITPGAEYIYRVYAFNDAGNSEPSNTVSVTAFTLY